jgi:hypothetical protein
VPSQQLQGQLQTEHSVDTRNYIMDKHREAPEKNTLMQKSKQTNKVIIIQLHSLLFAPSQELQGHNNSIKFFTIYVLSQQP